MHKCVVVIYNILNIRRQWRIQYFPDGGGGAPTQRWGCHPIILVTPPCRKLHEIEKLDWGIPGTPFGSAK